VDYSDADAWNAKFAASAAGRTAREVMDDINRSKGSFVAAALKVPEDRFEEGRAAYRILFTTGIDHYKEHLPQIREWREQEGI
jgi:fructose-specific phosphotransferase system component IIB